MLEDITCVARKPLPIMGMLLGSMAASLGAYAMSRAAILGAQSAGGGGGGGGGPPP